MPPYGSTPDMLVVVDSQPSSRASLAIAERYARGTVALCSWQATSSVGRGIEVQPSATADPTIAEALRAAAKRRIGFVGIRRDYAPPHVLLSQLLVATAKHTDDDIPGFAVFLADGEPRPFKRILAIAHHEVSPVSGLAAHAAVSVADTAGAVLDVLLIEPANPPDAVDGELELLAISREQELFQRAVERAKSSGLEVNFLPVTGVDDPWSLVLDQLKYHDYDLVIDDLGGVSLSRTRRDEAINEVLSPGQVGEVPLRLLTETELPLLLVIDEIRLGMAPAAMLKAGTVAALTIGVVGSTVVPAGAGQSVATAPGSEVPKPGTPEAVAEELRDALGNAGGDAPTDESTSEESESEDRADDSTSSSRGAATTSARAQAAAAAETASVKTVKAPKGGADPAAVLKAATQAAKDKKAVQKAKDRISKAEAGVADAEARLVSAQEGAEVALAELRAATLSYDEAATYADQTEDASTGVKSILPGSPTEQQAADARTLEQSAQTRLDAALERGESALGDLGEASDEVTDAETTLADREESLAASKADYAYSKEKTAVYRASLAETRQSPVAKGDYRLTARFGQAGGYWSSGYHTGLDFAGSAGTDILAAASGTVIEAGWDGAYGNRVVIDHGKGYQTTYNHLSDVDVQVGQKVSTGDQVGDMGATGNSTGTHLHFEVTRDGQFMDPESWLGW